MQIDRRTACGLPDPDEPLNKSQIYVNFFSKKLINLNQRRYLKFVLYL